MFFTQEDYRKIEKWLLANGRKDTDFAGAALPLKGNETVAFVQNGKNVSVFLKDLINQIFLLGVSDFLNVTDKYGESIISLTQAIQLIPFRSRKIGQVITFLDEEGHWRLYQFQGQRLNQWNNSTLWVDLIKQIEGISIIDSEDIVSEKDNLNQVSLKFADKNYNTADYSGLGRVYLRRNIQKVVDPETGNPYTTNLLNQLMLGKDNTIYIIQYDYNLNGQTIIVPENSILEFKDGGNLSNGILACNSTTIRIDNFDSLGVSLTGTYTVVSALNEDKSPYMNNTEYNPTDYSGLGHIYLRKNNGILTQTNFIKNNTIYHIRYDFDLKEKTISIPENCVLQFEGGSISNGTIIGAKTLIKSPPNKILNSVNLEGIFLSDFWYVEWLVEDITDDCSKALNALLYDFKFPKVVKLLQKEYIIKSFIKIDSNTVLEGNQCTIKSDFPTYYRYIFSLNSVENVIIKNLIINQAEVQDSTKNMNSSGTTLVNRAQVINAIDVNNLTISNCSLYYFGVSAIAVDSATRPEGVFRLDGCNFYFRRGNTNYDSSTIYAGCTTNIITNNYINGAFAFDDESKAATPSFGGVELHSPDSILSNNNIVKCGNAVNITPGDNYGKFLYWRGVTISNNVIGSCGKGIMYWCYGNIPESDSRTYNVNITGNTVEIGGGTVNSTALNAIGIVSSGGGSLHNVIVSDNIINYISLAAYHQTINVAPGINFSGNNTLVNLLIKNNIISNSPANAIVINHEENYRGSNISIDGNQIINCFWRSGYSIPNSMSYHYPISVTYCDNVNITKNKLYYTVEPSTSIWGLFYIHNCTKVSILDNKYENPSGTVLGGIDLDDITQIYTDDIVTRAYYYKDYPNSFKSIPVIRNEEDVCQLFIGDKLLTNNGNFKLAVDTYNNGEDYMFNGTPVVNNRIIWINRFPKFLQLGVVLKANNPESGLVGEYVVSMISRGNQCMFLYNTIGTKGINTTFETYKGELINDDGTLTSKVVVI